MDNINWSLVAPLIVIQLVLMLVALIDLRRTAATKGPRWMWALIIISSKYPRRPLLIL